MKLTKQQGALTEGMLDSLDERLARPHPVAREDTLRSDQSVALCMRAEEYDALGAEWNDLLDGAVHKSPFLKHQWMSIWWHLIGALSPSRQLFVLIARDENGKLAGALPFYRETHGRGPFRRRILRFLGTKPESPEHLDAIVRRENPTQIVDTLLATLDSLRSEYDAIELLDLADRSVLLPALSKWSRARGYTHRSWVWQECPYISTEGSFDKYLMTLSQKHRYKVRLFGRRLAAAHAVALEIAGAPAEVGAALEEMFQLHAKRWTLKTDDVSGFDDPAVHAFHRSVTQRLATDDAVRVFVLRCDGRAVAACYCFQYDRRLYFFQPGFDPEFRKLHVGKVLLGKVIEYCFRSGVREFDFLRGTEDYKFDWTRQKRPTLACNVAMTPYMKAIHSVEDARRRLEATRMLFRQRLVSRLKASPAGARALSVVKKLLRRPRNTTAGE